MAAQVNDTTTSQKPLTYWSKKSYPESRREDNMLDIAGEAIMYIATFAIFMGFSRFLIEIIVERGFLSNVLSMLIAFFITVRCIRDVRRRKEAQQMVDSIMNKDSSLHTMNSESVPLTRIEKKGEIIEKLEAIQGDLEDYLELWRKTGGGTTGYAIKSAMDGFREKTDFFKQKC